MPSTLLLTAVVAVVAAALVLPIDAQTYHVGIEVNYKGRNYNGNRIRVKLPNVTAPPAPIETKPKTTTTTTTTTTTSAPPGPIDDEPDADGMASLKDMAHLKRIIADNVRKHISKGFDYKKHNSQKKVPTPLRQTLEKVPDKKEEVNGKRELLQGSRTPEKVADKQEEVNKREETNEKKGPLEGGNPFAASPKSEGPESKREGQRIPRSFKDQAALARQIWFDKQTKLLKDLNENYKGHAESSGDNAYLDKSGLEWIDYLLHNSEDGGDNNAGMLGFDEYETEGFHGHSREADMENTDGGDAQLTGYGDQDDHYYYDYLQDGEDQQENIQYDNAGLTEEDDGQTDDYYNKNAANGDDEFGPTGDNTARVVFDADSNKYHVETENGGIDSEAAGIEYGVLPNVDSVPPGVTGLVDTGMQHENQDEMEEDEVVKTYHESGSQEDAEKPDATHGMLHYYEEGFYTHGPEEDLPIVAKEIEKNTLGNEDSHAPGKLDHDIATDVDNVPTDVSGVIDTEHDDQAGVEEREEGEKHVADLSSAEQIQEQHGLPDVPGIHNAVFADESDKDTMEPSNFLDNFSDYFLDKVKENHPEEVDNTENPESNESDIEGDGEMPAAVNDLLHDYEEEFQVHRSDDNVPPIHADKAENQDGHESDSQGDAAMPAAVKNLLHDYEEEFQSHSQEEGDLLNRGKEGMKYYPNEETLLAKKLQNAEIGGELSASTEKQESYGKVTISAPNQPISIAGGQKPAAQQSSNPFLRMAQLERLRNNQNNRIVNQHESIKEASEGAAMTMQNDENTEAMPVRPNSDAGQNRNSYTTDAPVGSFSKITANLKALGGAEAATLT